MPRYARTEFNIALDCFVTSFLAKTRRNLDAVALFYRKKDWVCVDFKC